VLHVPLIENMGVFFIPSPDVTVVLNTLLDILERRTSQNARHPTEHIIPQRSGVRATYNPIAQQSGRSIKISLQDIPLPSYFSQTDPTPRLVANEQFQTLEQAGLLRLSWVPGETGHLLQAISIPPLNGEYAALYSLLARSPAADQRARLESLLLGESFRFPESDWRGRAVRHILKQLKTGKSCAPFSLANPVFNEDLLTTLAALPGLEVETLYRNFSVRIFNDSKRFEMLKNALVSLARVGSPEWKRLPAEEVLRELNLVANPGYIHFSGNWQFTTADGQVLSLSGFFPSVGFPAAQTAQLLSATVHAAGVLCIENHTTFHEFIRQTENTARNVQDKYAVICTYGNPSPAIRRVLRLIPDETPIYHWSDLDYGGFNILSQMRRLVSERVQPYHMDIKTFEANARFARPLSATDRINLKRLLNRPELRDARSTIEYLLKRELKLEQEGIMGINVSSFDA
jgi:hypothetical protein